MSAEFDACAESAGRAMPGAAPPSIEWKKAWRALRALIADPERTDQVFEIIDACSGPSGERLFRAFVRDPEGQRLLIERPCLQRVLADRDALERLPAGSFGAAYLNFMREGELTAEGLQLASEEADAVAGDRAALDPARRWFFDRLRDMHDLWHVLTGYGRDEAGELANLAFTHAQTRNRGIALIVIAGALLGPKGERFAWQRYLLAAYRRGRTAVSLSRVPYETLLARPLAEVRFELGILPAEVVHPGGIIVASRDTEVAGIDSPESPLPAA